MDESVNIVLGHSIGDAFGTVNVHVCVGEVLRRVLAAGQIVDDIGVTDALLDGLGVAQVVFLRRSVRGRTAKNSNWAIQ